MLTSVTKKEKFSVF